MIWTPEIEKVIADEWLAGKSATEIAKPLGISRNAVIGKLSRLGVVRQRDKALDGVTPSKGVTVPKVTM